MSVLTEERAPSTYPRLPEFADLFVDDQVDAAIRLGVVLSVLPNDHPAVIAARAALEVRDGRAECRQAGLDVHSALTREQWRSWARNRVPFEELQRRRAGVGSGANGP